MDSAAAEAELRRGFTAIEVERKEPSGSVYHVYLNRPAQRNALPLAFFTEFPRALAALDALPTARSIVISARGPHFCAGIDISALGSVAASTSPDPAAAAEELRRRILALQAAITAIERCRKPVVAAIQGACVGAGVDLVTACDIRCCETGAYFEVKEVDLGLTADLGVLQRLPAIVGFGNAMDMALTARRVSGREAKEMGLVSRLFADPEALQVGAAALAKELGDKSGLAVMGTKAVMLRSRDLTVEDGLDHIATWNAGMLKSRDLEEAVAARLQKRRPNFSKL